MKNSGCRNRFLAEIKDSSSRKDAFVSLSVDDSDWFHWNARIRGPQNTPYQKGVFILDIRCPESFPMDPPKIAFKTPIFHPNINFKSGEVCMDILKNAWSPIWTLSCLCYAIISLLSEPNCDSPLNCDAGNLIRLGDLRGYTSVAEMYTMEYAACNSFLD